MWFENIMAKKNRMMKRKYIFLLLLLLLGIAFYMLNRMYPMIHDDYAYAFIFDNHSDIVRPTSNHISSLSDIFSSQWNHYLYVNGRMFAHILVQLFCGLLGKSFFDVLNSICLIVFCLGFNRLVNARISFLFLVLPFFLVFYNLPYPGQTIFWIAGGVNYFWSSTCALIFICIFLYFRSGKEFNYIDLLLGFFALCVAWMNEATSIPVSGGALIYILMNYKNISVQQKYWFFMYALGCAFIIFAPGTYTRLETGEDIQVSSNMLTFVFSRSWNMLLTYIKNPVSGMVFLITVTMLLFYRRFRELIQTEQFFIILFLFSSFFLWLLNMPDERVYFFYVICTWILLIRFLSYIPWSVNKVWQTSLGFVLLGLCIPEYIKAYNSINSFQEYNDQEIQRIKAASDKCFLIQHPYTGKKDKYVYVNELSDDISNYHNRVKAFYYDKDYIAAWPEDLYSIVTDTTMIEKMKFVSVNNNDSIQYTIVSEKYYLFKVPASKHKVHIKLMTKNLEGQELSEKQKLMRQLLGCLNIGEYEIKEYAKSAISMSCNSAFIYIPYKQYDTISFSF